MLKSCFSGFAKAVFALIAMAVCLTVQAQSYPTKPVRIIVPFGAGTPPDYLTRLVADNLTRTMGQPFIVDNRPGANSLVGLAVAAKADPDGYTIVYTDLAGLAINRSLYSKLPYDPDKDFAPVVMAFGTAFYVLVGGNSPHKSLRDLIAVAKSKPGKMHYGSIGNGSAIHLSTEDFKRREDIEVAHVPFKGADFLPALMRGDIDFMLLGIGAVSGLVAKGNIRALAIANDRRSAAFPEVPTVSEAGGPKDFTSYVWSAFVVPAQTPRPVIDLLNMEVNKVLVLPQMKKDLDRQDFVSLGGAPELVTKAVQADTVRYAELIQRTGAKID
jgi:tripartite-type tricarboxylate transporter receptor subunit TctC